MICAKNELQQTPFDFRSSTFSSSFSAQSQTGAVIVRDSKGRFVKDGKCHIHLKCLNCGENFIRGKWKVNLKTNFCSNKCSNQYRTKFSRNMVKCQMCDKEFNICSSTVKKGGGKYCSLICYTNYKKQHFDDFFHRCKVCGNNMRKIGDYFKCFRNHDIMKHAIYKRNCDYCGKYYEGRGEKYCSKRCNCVVNSPYKKGHKNSQQIINKIRDTLKQKYKSGEIPRKDSRTKKSCTICGTQFKTYHPNQEYCSVKCGRLSLKKENGMIKDIRRRSDYKKWRKKIITRDNHTCQNCGNRTFLHVHHINPVAIAFELIFNLDNGITLCKRCHINLHKKMVVQNLT